MPYMHPRAAERFYNLREIIRAGAGCDFLAKCGDICRTADFTSSKDGVANRSWHKTGRAVDYNQNDPHLVIVSEPKNGRQFFRTYLKCVPQTGALGKMMTVKDYRGYSVTAYLFDFTTAAEAIGFHRIPAWSGWQANYNRREFWHSQFDEGLTWDAAMLQLQGKDRPAAEQVLGLNDRGDDVRAVQSKLADLKFLPRSQADGVFGAFTKAAVIAFQRANRLDADGLVGHDTRKQLFG